MLFENLRNPFRRHKWVRITEAQLVIICGALRQQEALHPKAAPSVPGILAMLERKIDFEGMNKWVEKICRGL